MRRLPRYSQAAGAVDARQVTCPDALLPAAIDLAENVGGGSLSHGSLPELRREHNRSLSHQRLDQLPMISLTWGMHLQIASLLLQECDATAPNSRPVEPCHRK